MIGLGWRGSFKLTLETSSASIDSDIACGPRTYVPPYTAHALPHFLQLIPETSELYTPAKSLGDFASASVLPDEESSLPIPSYGSEVSSCSDQSGKSRICRRGAVRDSICHGLGKVGWKAERPLKEVRERLLLLPLADINTVSGRVVHEKLTG